VPDDGVDQVPDDGVDQVPDDGVSQPGGSPDRTETRNR